MDKLKSYQEKLFREFEKSKYCMLASPLTKASIMPEFYRIIEKAYKKGYKRAKSDMNDVINKIDLDF